MSHIVGRVGPSFQFNWLRPIGLALLVAGLAHAVTITVPCSGSGGGASGLIAAINTSNSTPGSNTINLTPGCVYTLTLPNQFDDPFGHNGLPPITGIITINGYGATIARHSESAFRILAVASEGTLILNTVTVRSGLVYGSGGPDAAGGGLFVDAGGTLTLNYSVVTENVANSLGPPGGGFGTGYGGGIYNRGKVTLNYSVVSKNGAASSAEIGSAFGGGIANDNVGVLTLNCSTVTHNGAGSAGGISSAGRLIIRHSVVSYNTARSDAANGGGIVASGATSLAYSVIRNNTATATTGRARGGGIDFQGSERTGTTTALSLYRSVIYSNTASSNGSETRLWPNAAGGGLAISGKAATLLYSVVHCNIARAPAGQARGGGIENSSSGIATLKYGKVVNNTAQGATLANSLGGGIYNANPASGSVTLIANPVTGNHPDQCDPTGSVPGCSN